MFKRFIKVVILFILAISIIFSFTFILKKIHYKCFYNEFFNIYCMGCGTTRMFESIFKLEFYQAFRYNEFMFIIVILLLIYLIYSSIIYIKDGIIKKIPLKIIIIFIILGFIFMILRNIPSFSYLQPKKVL